MDTPIERHRKRCPEGKWERIVANVDERLTEFVRCRLGDWLRRLIDPRDIVQETYLTATRKLDDFHPKGPDSFFRWKLTIAEHKITDAAAFHLAKKRSVRRDVPFEAIDETKAGVHGGTNPADRVERDEQAARVDAAIAELRPCYRDLIILRDFAGASWSTIARLLGRPSCAAARMMHRAAIRKLGKQLHERPERKPVGPSTNIELPAITPNWICWLDKPTWVCDVHGHRTCVNRKARRLRDLGTVECLEYCMHDCPAMRGPRVTASVTRMLSPNECRVRILHVPVVGRRGRHRGSINCAFVAPESTHK